MEVTAVRNEPDKARVADEHRPVVMLDGAYIRAVPGRQVRNFEAICGKVEREGHPTRRFALVRSLVEQPHALLRAALQDQGWREGEAVTAISDGDPALPALVRSATGGPVELILDWRCACTMPSRSWTACASSSRRLSSRPTRPRSTCNGCDTCSGTATTTRRVRLWVGS